MILVVNGLFFISRFRRIRAKGVVLKGKFEMLEESRGKDMREILAEAYQQHKTQSGVARSLGISQGTLSYWLLKLNLEQRVVLVERQS